MHTYSMRDRKQQLNIYLNYYIQNTVFSCFMMTFHRHNGFYTVQTVFFYYPTPTLPLSGNFYFLKKSHSVWFTSLFPHGDITNVPTRSKCTGITILVGTFGPHEVINQHSTRTHARTEPDLTKCDMFLYKHLCWPWNNIVINQSDLKNKFIIFISVGLQSVFVACTSVSFIYNFLWF